MVCYPDNLQKFPREKIKIAGIVVFHDPSKKILLLEKKRGDYDLPKGHVNNDETFLEGALRECYEETGLHHRHNLNVFPYTYISVPSKKWLRFYLGFTQETDIVVSEHVDYYWASIREAIAMLGSDNQLAHIIKAMDALCPNN